MQRIYIILTHTGTMLSRLIKSYTKDEFSHVSIALDYKLEKMYSFGRLNPYNPFIGGFIHEGISFGTFKRFKSTNANVYSLEVTDQQYKDIEEIINYIKNTKELQKFNIIGLFAAGFHKKISFKNSFYCAEFVKYVLENSNIKVNLPEAIKPEDFKKLENIELIYSGKLKDYNVEKIKILEKLMNITIKEKAVV